MLIAAGHPPDVVMGYTLPQAVSFARLTERRQTGMVVNLMHATRIAVKASDKDYRTEIGKLDDG